MKRYHLADTGHIPLQWSVLDMHAFSQPKICARLANKADARALQGWLSRNKLEILYVSNELGINCKPLLCAFNQLGGERLLWPHRF